LRRRTLDDQAIGAAAEAAFGNARGREHNAFKIELGKRTLARALRQAAALQI
jgi:xanthine dehydrogenase YagS FAD-binding subunit